MLLDSDGSDSPDEHLWDMTADIEVEDTSGKTEEQQEEQYLTKNNEQQEAIRNLETSLCQTNKGKKVRVVLVENDSERQVENEPNKENRHHFVAQQNDSDSTEDHQVFNTQNNDFCLTVEADVHYPAVPHWSEDSVQQDYNTTGYASAVAAPDVDEGHQWKEGSGVRPNIRKLTAEQNEETLSDEACKKIGRPAQLNFENQVRGEVNWGEEESSESDEELHWEGGDIPLLPR